ncbi:hypothetical protein [Amycolatopsis minnesotensis]
MSVINAERHIDYAADANAQEVDTERDAQHHGLLANAEATLAVAEELRKLREALCGNEKDKFDRGALGDLVAALTPSEGVW